MARGWIHTVHSEGAWWNEVEGGGSISRYATKKAAAEAGREAAQARQTEHVIHNLDGTIAGRSSFESEPVPPRA